MLGTKIGVLGRLLLVTTVGIEVGSSECFTDGTKDDMVDGFLLRYLLVSVYTIELSNK